MSTSDFKGRALAAFLAVTSIAPLALTPVQEAFANPTVIEERYEVAHENGYKHIVFDANMKARHPKLMPVHVAMNEAMNIVVLNFIDQTPQGKKYSDMQTKVLQQTLAALAPKSTAKGLVLVDVVVRDEAGQGVYSPDFYAFYQENKLGPNGATIPDVKLPYGVVRGTSLVEGQGGDLFDFALMNGVQNDADLNAKAQGIFGQMAVMVDAYNKKNAIASGVKPEELVFN